MLLITKRFRFEAAHFLPFHGGKCKNLHGHSYVLEVTVAGEVKSTDSGSAQSGMVMDFSVLKSIVDENVISVFDHSNLNREDFYNPTAELLVQCIASVLQEKLPKDIYLYKLLLHETEDSWVEWCNFEQFPIPS